MYTGAITTFSQSNGTDTLVSGQNCAQAEENYASEFDRYRLAGLV
jgi:hypothetical protein